MIDGSVLQSAQRCFEKKSRAVVKMVVIANFDMADDGVLSERKDREREIQRMEREESHSNSFRKGCIGQMY